MPLDGSTRLVANLVSSPADAVARGAHEATQRAGGDGLSPRQSRARTTPQRSDIPRCTGIAASTSGSGRVSDANVTGRPRRPEGAPGMRLPLRASSGRRKVAPVGRDVPDANDDGRPETTDAIQDYAKAIYALEQRHGDVVSTTALANRLGVTSGSASSMLKRLNGLGLVAHVPYRGVRLTVAGRRVALEVLRRHRLLERFLSDELGVPWDRVHTEAEVLEHVLSEELAERIAPKLGYPSHDPHGDPIPTVDGRINDIETRSLDDLGPGERGVIARVSDSDPEMLRYLADRGIAIGMEVAVHGREPFEGPLSVSLGEHAHVLGRAVARAIRVRGASD